MKCPDCQSEMEMLAKAFICPACKLILSPEGGRRIISRAANVFPPAVAQTSICSDYRATSSSSGTSLNSADAEASSCRAEAQRPIAPFASRSESQPSIPLRPTDDKIPRMEYGNAVKDLLARGYSIEWSTDETRVVRVTNRSGDTLEEPSSAELVQLVTGMTMKAIREARISN